VARRQRNATDYFLGARGDLTFLQLAFGYLIGRIGVAIWLLPG
jgi:hypothetical protein